MAKQRKSEILNFLMKNTSESVKMNVVTIAEKTGIGYPAVLKWTEVLKANNRIQIDDYGNEKLIWYDKKKDVLKDE